MLDRLDGLGLSPFEATIPKQRLLSAIRPPQIEKDSDVEAAVYGKVVASLN